MQAALSSVAAFSVATVDYYPQQGKHYPGGNALNQAVRFAQMGLHSAFVGALGADVPGDQITALLASESVDVSHVHRIRGRTATNQIVVDESGERFGVEGAWKGGVYEGYELSASDWTFLEGFDVWSTHANCPSYAEALERKRDRQTMTVDFLHLLDHDLLAKSLQMIDIAYIGGTPDMAADLAALAQASPRGIIVLTLGAEGNIAFERDGITRQEALPLDRVIDTTGCGDAFQAGFTARYVQTRDVRASLLAGAELGRAAAQHFGGTRWHRDRVFHP
jgi:sugar/nucleoside kinase (ribokinase family)